MAPELALETLKTVHAGSAVLDPMTGSGTVIRQAVALGHRAIGVDVDPLAVLISRVMISKVEDQEIEYQGRRLLRAARKLNPSTLTLPWIDNDQETRKFVNYWFDKPQQRDLRRLAFLLHRLPKNDCHSAGDVLRIALSRIIVTKEGGASLARDAAHSRPHRVTLKSDYDVLTGYERSLTLVRERMPRPERQGHAVVELGDARALDIEAGSIDCLLTSPPYLNAIDYMRGHRLSLVWFGYGMSELRSIRTGSVGTEMGLDVDETNEFVTVIREAMGYVSRLPPRFQRIVNRYAVDLGRLMKATALVLKPTGRATFVIGNSCLRGIFIRNADALVAAARLCELKLQNRYDRDLPAKHRYLPVTADGALSRRMSTETILTFERTRIPVGYKPARSPSVSC